MITARRPARAATSDSEPLAARRMGADRWLLLITILLLGAGLVMVFSASQALAYLQHRSTLYYFERQAAWMGLGLVAMAVLMRIDYHRLESLAKPAAGLVAVLMLAVLVPHIGVQVNGARRWIDLGPLGTFQPSEVGKLAFALYAASWIDRRGDRLRSLGDGLIPFVLILGGVLFLLMLEKDLGTALVMSAIFGSAFLTGGGRFRHMFLLAAGVLAAIALLTVLEPYRMARFSTFTDPFADRLGAGFQATQGLLALGTGGITGIGLGHSVEKFLWLPEAHTDFIFAIVGEETGLIGTSLLLAGFLAFGIRGYRAALRAPDRFGLIAASAITTWIAFQALINMGTVTDTLPITGVPLPFISYGGTAVAVSLAAVGVLLNISSQGDDRARLRMRRKDAALDIGRGDRWSPVPGPGRRTRPAR